MGINGAKSALWICDQLSLKTILELKVGNRIDVDGNAIAWKLFMSKKLNNPHISVVIHEMAHLLKKIAHSGGMVVTVVVDGDNRPDCKRATLFRRKKRDLDDIQRLYCRIKSSKLIANIARKKHDNLCTRKEEDELAEIDKIAKSLEKRCNGGNLNIPKDFAMRLSEKLLQINACTLNENGGYVQENVLKAKFQADYVIARRVNEGKTDLIFSEDSDFVALLGNKCLLLKKVQEAVAKPSKRGRKKKDTDEQINEQMITDASQLQVVLAGGCNVQMETLRDRLINHRTKGKWMPAVTPMFQSESPKLRAMMALTFGCDVFPNGWSGVGYKNANAMLNDLMISEAANVKENNWSGIENKYKTKLAHGLQVETQVVDTLVNSFLFEPGTVMEGTIATVNEEMNVEGYIDKLMIPTSLSVYLESFALPGVKVEKNECENVLVCNGSFNTSGNRSHRYLGLEGSVLCSMCNVTFCRSCAYCPEKDNKVSSKERIIYADCKEPFCLDCFRTSRLGMDVPNEPESSNQSSNDKSLKDIMSELSKRFGVQMDNKATLVETMDIYEAYISSPNNIFSHHQKYIKEQVIFPIHQSSVLNNETSTGINVFGSLKFREGGKFISDKNLVNDDDLPKVLNLISTILEYDDTKLVSKDTVIAKYSNLPTIFHNFAVKSRADSGQRLLKRCARHACDPRTPSLFDESFKLFKSHSGKIGIILTGVIPASMEKETKYNPKIAFTSDTIEACSCDCKAGSDNLERGLCVHNLPLMLLLFFLLHDGLLDNILVELCNRWTNAVELKMKENDEVYNSCNASITNLLNASGNHNANSNKCILEKLSKFRVGTEKAKVFIPKPKDSELIPLRKMVIGSNKTLIDQKLPNKKNDLKDQPDKCRKNQNDNSTPIILKKDKGTGSVCPVTCDFCKRHSTSHICRYEDSFGQKIIEGTNMRICGLAFCFECRESNGTLEGGDGTRLCFHHHPECMIPMVGNEVELLDDPIDKYVPNYVQIQACIEALQLYRNKEDQELHCQEKFIGHKLLRFRCNEELKKKDISMKMMYSMVKNNSIQWKNAFKLTKARLPKKTGRYKRKRRETVADSNNDTKENESIENTVRKKRRGHNLHNARSTKLAKHKCILPLQKHRTTDSSIEETTQLNAKRVTSSHETKQLNAKRRTSSFVCCYKGCKNSSKQTHLRFRCVPLPPPQSQIDMCARTNDPNMKKNMKSYYRKKVRHSLYLRRIGVGLDDFRPSMRICSMHKNEEVKVQQSVEVNGRPMTFNFIFEDIPAGEGIQTISDVKSDRSISARQKSMLREWEMHANELKSKFGEEAAEEMLEVKKMNVALLEVEKDDTICMNEKSEMSMKLLEHFGVMHPDRVVESTKSSVPKNANIQEEKMKSTQNIQPTYTPYKDTLIKEMCGFESDDDMICFIITVCNGDFDVMTNTVSRLTWYEEWLLYFDCVWGRGEPRWNKKIMNRYNIPRKILLYKIFDSKNELLLKCRRSWPTYASLFHEDAMLRKDKWNEKYAGRRIVMWDDTNVSFTYQPSTALNQRATFSSYYGENCAKGASFLQLCGWLGVYGLYVGAISDTHYMEKSTILKNQQQFQEKEDLVIDEKGEAIPFTNILDKGYRIVRLCYRHGKQLCMQPVFAKSDEKFRSDDMLASASVAADRSGNERGVNRCKYSGWIKRGLRPNSCPKRLDNVWLAWSFQTNFMYEPVL